ncbi:4-hydroxy-tetrahydrodipicolinate synthase [Thermopetrobacter sp. TC1]|uniref:4-hydroxy-tetrahydrodipicolinate synthase n=1 Tax=Thermopetrobacter sp. TC1 TaxID=1495045 RepID=UPI000570FABD|nr:4-hydroxy-tetrahydrodipicolinate synthase [Thermopetrobacter sp. TC1]
MAREKFKGSFPALITPMTEDGEVDEAAMRRFVDWQIEQGSDGLVAVGTTGESPTLSHEEHKRVVEIVVEQANGRVPVIAGTGSNSTAEAIDFTRHAEKAGADAALVVVPYYNKPTQAGLYAHFRAVAEATSLPVFIYNVPGRTVADISNDTIVRLARDCPNIIGIKDATGDLTRVSMLRLELGEEFVQLSGEDGTALGFNAHGGVGCISVTANVAPALCAEFQKATREGDFARALKLQDKLMPLHKAMFVETSPGPVKYAVSLLGFCTPFARLPMVEIAESSKEAVKAAMRHAGLLD